MELLAMALILLLAGVAALLAFAEGRVAPPQPDDPDLSD
jgi:hypothetical protein